jgi:hypothetical protein
MWVLEKCSAENRRHPFWALLTGAMFLGLNGGNTCGIHFIRASVNKISGWAA